MIPTEPTTTRRSVPREAVGTRDDLATLTCPNCLGTRMIPADIRAEAPCPLCQYPLVDVPPVPPQAPVFIELEQRIGTRGIDHGEPWHAVDQPDRFQLGEGFAESA